MHTHRTRIPCVVLGALVLHASCALDVSDETATRSEPLATGDAAVRQEPKKCSSGSDCNDFNTCTQDKCTNGTCDNSVQVPDGQSCAVGGFGFGKCQGGQCLKSCSKNGDCGVNTSCWSSECVSGYCKTGPSNENGSCKLANGGDGTCHSGACQPPTCKNDSDCPGSPGTANECYGGKCVDGACTVGQKSGTCHFCSAPQCACSNGTCLPVKPSRWP